MIEKVSGRLFVFHIWLERNENKVEWNENIFGQDFDLIKNFAGHKIVLFST